LWIGKIIVLTTSSLRAANDVSLLDVETHGNRCLYNHDDDGDVDGEDLIDAVNDDNPADEELEDEAAG
jgi:hypothetical protein